MVGPGRRVLLATAVALAVGAIYVWISRGEPQRSDGADAGGRRVLLIGLDGGSFDLVRQWAAEGKMPVIAGLLAEGAHGYLGTVETPRQPGKNPSISSPVLWTTIATGKLPDKHGVWDFGQPLPETLYAWTSNRAEVAMPTTLTTDLHLSFAMKTADGVGSAEVAVALNGHKIGVASVDAEPSVARCVASADIVSPQRNVLAFEVVSHTGDPTGGTGIVGCRRVAAESAEGDLLGVIDPWRDAPSFESGWQMPDTTARPLIQTAHRQARAFWDILSEKKRTVATVGWWGTWPAYEVNGLMLSSHLGIRGKKTMSTRDQATVLGETPNLTFPEEYLRHIVDSGLVPSGASSRLRDEIVDTAGCSFSEGTINLETVEDVFAQDLFYTSLAGEIASGGTAYDVLAVYIEGLDVIQHKFYDFYAGRRPKGEAWISCPGEEARLAVAVENYYLFVDRMLGDLLAKAGNSYDTTMIVTDHGFNEHGHANNGMMLMRGPGLRRTVLRQASVRDVTPTLLYMLGLPVARDMDGRVLTEAFADEYLRAHPPAAIRTYETSDLGFKPAFAAADKDMEDRLRALGYIE